MQQPFIRSKNIPVFGYDIKTLLGHIPTKGDIGLEIECEGNKFEKLDGNLGPFWTYHKDHSLRGKDNAEYVLGKPIAFDKVPDAIASLWKTFNKFGTVLDVSNRTSVHVHLNCQHFHLNRLTSFMALYFIVEEVLTAWCGDHRVGNLFCLRAKDAPSMLSKIIKFIRKDGNAPLSESLHYGGLNAHALIKFGSLEIRTLRGCTDPATINDWVNILRRLYDLSADFKDPRDICGMFSAEGPASFFDTILGDTASIVRNGVEMSEDQIRDTLYEGVRIAQDLCYCRDWSLYSETKLDTDPFGRDPRKVSKALKMAAHEAQLIAAAYTTGDGQWATVSTQAPVMTPQMPSEIQLMAAGLNPFEGMGTPNFVEEGDF